jgi:hypothetical protein
MQIYLTHCSKVKSLFAKESGEKMTPDQLYTDPEVQAFIRRCREVNSSWAILSDFYGVFFPNEQHEYYEKPPSDVTPEEEKAITKNFHTRLNTFGEIRFYVRKETIHPFYERIIRNGPLAERVILIYDLASIINQ